MFIYFLMPKKYKKMWYESFKSLLSEKVESER